MFIKKTSTTFQNACDQFSFRHQVGVVTKCENENKTKPGIINLNELKQNDKKDIKSWTFELIDLIVEDLKHIQRIEDSRKNGASFEEIVDLRKDFKNSDVPKNKTLISAVSTGSTFHSTSSISYDHKSKCSSNIRNSCTKSKSINEPFHSASSISYDHKSKCSSSIQNSCTKSKSINEPFHSASLISYDHKSKCSSNIQNSCTKSKSKNERTNNANNELSKSINNEPSIFKYSKHEIKYSQTPSIKIKTNKTKSEKMLSVISIDGSDKSVHKSQEKNQNKKLLDTPTTNFTQKILEIKSQDSDLLKASSEISTKNNLRLSTSNIKGKKVIKERDGTVISFGKKKLSSSIDKNSESLSQQYEKIISNPKKHTLKSLINRPKTKIVNSSGKSVNTEMNKHFSKIRELPIKVKELSQQNIDKNTTTIESKVKIKSFNNKNHLSNISKISGSLAPVNKIVFTLSKSNIKKSNKTK